MKIDVKIVRAFAVNESGGNPAGIVFNADQFTDVQKQKIATILAFPETAFVSQSEKADFKLDFFTPTKQIPHCGHATIATFSYLKKQGRILTDRSSIETIDGIREILFRGDSAHMEQAAPVFTRLKDDQIDIVLDSLHLKLSDLIEGLRPTIVNTGNGYLIVPVKNAHLLSKVIPDLKKISRVSEDLGLIGYYLYSHPDNVQNIQATTRMFAPFYGIPEEAGTGMAAGPLACYLCLFVNDQSNEFLIEQGKFMTPPSPSLLHAQLVREGSTIKKLYVGGSAYLANEISIDL